MSVNVVGNATDLERVNTSSESGNVKVDAADTGSVSLTDNGQTQGQTWASGESSLFPPVLSSKLFNKNVLYISLPHNLKSVRIDNLVQASGLTNPVTFIFRGGENLEEIHLTRMPGLFVTLVNVFGLNNVKLLDLSYSLVQVKTETLFDNFLGIEILLLRSLLPNNYFDSVMPVKKLIRNMTQLRYLEIAQNDLNFLLPGTFSTNPQLTHLILSENRFTSIPFDLRLTPKLEVLDLSRNAIMYLDGDDIAAINAHVAQGAKFIFKLEGNNLVCVCSQFIFLVWLQSTTAILDNEGNYTCSSQDGTMATTEEFSDMLGFWRQCNGWSWLMMSIVLALVLLVSLLTTYLTSRFRCAIKAFMLRMMFPQFRPMKPQDYRTDVIVCYADDDFRFVRNVLQGFLEGDLNLRTHIHQRDLDVGGYKDDQFCEAIENSWRVLLIITENFLHNYDMADIVMKFACYGVGPANQGRVFALVEQTQLNMIPRNLHAVLDDNRIIVIHDLDGPLGYEQKQSIQNCLRPVN